MHGKMPKAFIFDLDGVITDTAHYHFLAWKQLASELSLKFDKADNERLKGVSRIRSFEIILEINHAMHRFTPEMREHYANLKNEHYVELIKQVSPNDVLENVLQLLKDARENGVKCAIASASKNAAAVLCSLQLSDSFDYIADAALVKKSKPDPEVFLNCVEYLGLAPEDCVGFEDAQAGIEAIHAANMFSVGINVEITTIMPDFIVASTKELYFVEICEKYAVHTQN